MNCYDHADKRLNQLIFPSKRKKIEWINQNIMVLPGSHLDEAVRHVTVCNKLAQHTLPFGIGWRRYNSCTVKGLSKIEATLWGIPKYTFHTTKTQVHELSS